MPAIKKLGYTTFFFKYFFKVFHSPFRRRVWNFTLNIPTHFSVEKKKKISNQKRVDIFSQKFLQCVASTEKITEKFLQQKQTKKSQYFCRNWEVCFSQHLFSFLTSILILKNIIRLQFSCLLILTSCRNTHFF